MPPLSWPELPYDIEPLAPSPNMHPFLTHPASRPSLNDRQASFDDSRRATFDDRIGQKLHPFDRSASNLDRVTSKVSQVSRVDAAHSGGGAPMVLPRQSDVTIFVGKHRTPYVLSIDSLRGSSYFRSILDRKLPDPSSPRAPIVIDCEESVFQNMMTVLRYGSFEALPKMSESEKFKLRKELEFYGIQALDSSSKTSSAGSSSPACSPPATSPVASSPRSPSGSELNDPRHFSLAELPEFPTDLTDPAKLVLVSRLDEDPRGRCPCATDQKPSQWALNFYHRHAFCTRCGRSPSSMPPKFLAEMFMVAASYFAGEKLNPKKWLVGCDSICTLKFVSSKSCCGCSCSRQTVWAASTYHSHAFCTQCGRFADGAALVCILLTLRYGGLQKSPKGKREHLEVPIGRETPSLQPVPSRTPSRTASYGSQRSA